MEKRGFIYKRILRTAMLGGIFILSSCLKVDPPNKPNAVESFQGDMRVEFALKEFHPGVHGINFGFFTTNKGGDQIIISQIPNNEFEVIPKELFQAMLKTVLLSKDKEETLSYKTASSYDFSVLVDPKKLEAQPELLPQTVIDEGFIQPPIFAGLIGSVNGNVITIEDFEMTNTTVEMTGCKVEGTIERSGNTMMTTQPIEIYCDVEQMVEYFGEDPLKILYNDDTGEVVLNQEKVVLWRIHVLLNQPLSVT